MRATSRFRGFDFRALGEAGAQFVLCRRAPLDSRAARAPARRNWRREFPHWEDAYEWGGRVGVIPASVGMTVADVDHGDWRDAAAAAPPAAVVGSRHPGRRHLWYWDETRRRNRKFRRPSGCAGEIRGGNGYVVVWSPSALSSIVETVCRRRVFSSAGVFVPAAFPSAPDEPPSAVPPAALAGVIAGCEDAQVGERNVRLFDELRFWAYAHAPDGGGSDAWDTWLSACTARALGLAAGMAEPLPPDEVRATAASVARYVFAGGRRYSELDVSSAVQAARGRKSGEVRRARVYARDELIVKMHEAGFGYKRLSGEFGLSVGGVRRIVRRSSLVAQAL